VRSLSTKEELTIRTPVVNEAVLMSLKVGDVIYITGTIVTARDAVHKRVVREGKPPPVDLRGLAIFHAGPVMIREAEGWRCISIGPTTSRRMEYYEYEFIEKTGVKIVIGKGGMGARTAEACKKFKAIYTIFPGGCGVLGASRVKRVAGVEWLDLGIPEAMWILEVENFGPLIVAIDAHGNNLADAVLDSARAKKDAVTREIVEKLRIL
jgi:L(+)-tartrate dehydratase beta subunit